MRSEGISRVVPPPPGSILLVPAGNPARYRWSSHSDSLHVFLEPGLVARVAAEAFELDPARVSVPPLDGVDLPQLRAAMLAVCAELTADAAGGRLAVESLANVMAVHLIRNASAPRRTGPQDGRRTAAGETPRRRRVRRGTPRRRPDPGADRRGRPPQPLPLRAAVQGGHGTAAAPVRHRPPRRTGAATPARRATSPCRRSRPAPASRTRASSPITSSASSASRRGSSAGPQETPKRPQAAPRSRAASRLGFLRERARVAGMSPTEGRLD